MCSCLPARCFNVFCVLTQHCLNKAQNNNVISKPNDTVTGEAGRAVMCCKLGKVISPIFLNKDKMWVCIGRGL